MNCFCLCLFDEVFFLSDLNNYAYYWMLFFSVEVYISFKIYFRCRTIVTHLFAIKDWLIVYITFTIIILLSRRFICTSTMKGSINGTDFSYNSGENYISSGVGWVCVFQSLLFYVVFWIFIIFLCIAFFKWRCQFFSKF